MKNKKARFFQCEICKIVDLMLFEGIGQKMCCGQNMRELKPNTSDGAGEKHVPVIKRDGNKVTVEVSSVEHPMVPEHFITLVAVEYNDKIQIQYLDASDKPTATFDVPENAKVTAYEFCNLHGLWMTEEA